VSARPCSRARLSPLGLLLRLRLLSLVGRWLLRPERR
jgi:hypothetical protein